VTDGLLLVHAFPLDSTMWRPQILAFSERVSTVAPSLPGFEGAPSAGEVMTMRAAADACVAALDDEEVERAVVCALSMGGYVALELWRSHRDRVLGFLLANTRAVADDPAARERRLALAERLVREGSGFLVEDPPPLLSESAEEGLRAEVRAIISRQPASAVAAASRGMAERNDSTPDLATIDLPTLVISSTGDTLIPPDATRAMADAIPGAAFELIDGAGHLSNLEAPDEFNELLRQHLIRCGLL
jgi:pimeloyl-ACP methyl ester carboxylesterase